MKVQITPNYIALALYLSSSVAGVSAGEYQHRGGGGAGGERGDAIVPAARPGPAAEPRGDQLALVANNSHQDDPGGTLATIGKDKRDDDGSPSTKLNDRRGIGDIAEAAGRVVDTLHNVGSSSLTELSTGDRQRLIGARPEPGATPSKWPPYRGVKWISPFNPWPPVGRRKDALGRWLSKKQRAKNKKKDGNPRPAKKAKKEPKRPKKKGPPWVGPTIYDEHPGPKGGFGPKTDPGGSAIAAAAAKRAGDDDDVKDQRDFLDVLGTGTKIAKKVQGLAGSGLPPAHWPRPASWHDRPGSRKRKRLPFSKFKAGKQAKAAKKEEPPWTPPVIHDEHPFGKGGFGPDFGPGSGGSIAVAAKRDDGHPSDKRGLLDIVEAAGDAADTVKSVSKAVTTTGLSGGGQSRRGRPGSKRPHWASPLKDGPFGNPGWSTWDHFRGDKKRKTPPRPSRTKPKKEPKRPKRKKPAWVPPRIYDEHPPFGKGGFGFDNGPGSGGAGVAIAAKRDDETSLPAKRPGRDQLPLSTNEKRAIVKLLENSHEIAQALRESGGVITTKVNGAIKEIRPTPAAASSSNEWKPSPALRQALLAAFHKPKHPGGRPKGSKNKSILGLSRPSPKPKGPIPGTKQKAGYKTGMRKGTPRGESWGRPGPKPKNKPWERPPGPKGPDPDAGGAAGALPAIKRAAESPLPFTTAHEKRAILELLENAEQLAHALREARGVITSKVGDRIVETPTSAAESSSSTPALLALPRPRHPGGRPEGKKNREGAGKPGPPKGRLKGTRGPYRKKGVICGKYSKGPKICKDRHDSSDPGSGGAAGGSSAVSKRTADPSIHEKRAILKLLEHSDQLAHALREAGGVITTKIGGRVVEKLPSGPGSPIASSSASPSAAKPITGLLALPRPKHAGGRPKGVRNRQGSKKPGPPKGVPKGPRDGIAYKKAPPKGRLRGPYKKNGVLCGRYCRDSKKEDRPDSSGSGSGGAGGASAVPKRSADLDKRAILELLEHSDQLAHALREAGGVITSKVHGVITETPIPGMAPKPKHAEGQSHPQAPRPEGGPVLFPQPLRSFDPTARHAGTSSKPSKRARGRPRGVKNKLGALKPGRPQGTPKTVGSGAKKGSKHKDGHQTGSKKGVARGPYKKKKKAKLSDDHPDAASRREEASSLSIASKRAILELLENSTQLAHALREAGGVITSKVNGALTQTPVPDEMMPPKPKYRGGRPKGSKNKPKYKPHPQSPKKEAGPILFPQPLRYFDPSAHHAAASHLNKPAHPSAADTMKKPLLALPRPKHAGGRPKGSPNKQGARRPGPGVGWSRPIGAKKPGPKAGTPRPPRPLGAKKTGPQKGSRQKQGYKTGTKKGSVRGPYKKKPKLHDDRPGPSDDGSGSGASSAAAVRKRAILELLENSTQFAHALREAGGVVTSKVNGMLTETQHELPPSQEHPGGPVLNPQPLRSFDGAAHAAANAAENPHKRKRRPGGGRPKGAKNKDGYKKPGPTKGTPRPQGSMKPGPKSGSSRSKAARPRPEGAKKPGPLPGTPRPKGAKKPGPPKGRVRPDGLNKPGPKKGSKQKQGYKVGNRGRPSKKPKPTIPDDRPASHQGPGPNGDGAGGASSATVATTRSIDDQASPSNEKRVVGEILEGLGGVFRSPAFEQLENVGQGATAKIAPSALQRLVKSRLSKGAGPSTPLRKGPHWRELIRKRRRKGAQKHKKLKGQWRNAHGLGSSSDRRALDGYSAESSLELVKRDEPSPTLVNRGIGDLAEAFEHAVKIQEKVSDHLKAESKAGPSFKAKPFAALKKELRRLPVMRPTHGTPFKKTARKAKKAISGKGDKMLLEKHKKRGISELAEAFDKAVKISDKVSGHDESSSKPASSATTKPSPDKSRVIRPKRKKESHHSPYADDAEQQKLFRWAKNRDPRREWAKSLSLAFKHPDRHDHAKAPSPPKSPPAASSEGDARDVIDSRGFEDLVDTFHKGMKLDEVKDKAVEASGSSSSSPRSAAQPPALAFPPGKKKFPGLGVQRPFKKKVQKEYIVKHSWSGQPVRFRNPLWVPDESTPAKSRFKPPRKQRPSLSTKSPDGSPCSSPPSGSPCKFPGSPSGGSDAMAIGRRGSEDLLETFNKGLKIVDDAKEKVDKGEDRVSSIRDRFKAESSVAKSSALGVNPTKMKSQRKKPARLPEMPKECQKKWIHEVTPTGTHRRIRNPLWSKRPPGHVSSSRLSSSGSSGSFHGGHFLEPPSSTPSWRSSSASSPGSPSDATSAMAIDRRGSDDDEFLDKFKKGMKIFGDAKEKAEEVKGKITSIRDKFKAKKASGSGSGGKGPALGVKQPTKMKPKRPERKKAVRSRRPEPKYWYKHSENYRHRYRNPLWRPGPGESPSKTPDRSPSVQSWGPAPSSSPSRSSSRPSSPSPPSSPDTATSAMHIDRRGLEERSLFDLVGAYKTIDKVKDKFEDKFGDKASKLKPNPVKPVPLPPKLPEPKKPDLPKKPDFPKKPPLPEHVASKKDYGTALKKVVKHEIKKKAIKKGVMTAFKVYRKTRDKNKGISVSPKRIGSTEIRVHAQKRVISEIVEAAVSPGEEEKARRLKEKQDAIQKAKDKIQEKKDLFDLVKDHEWEVRPPYRSPPSPWPKWPKQPERQRRPKLLGPSSSGVRKKGRRKSSPTNGRKSGEPSSSGAGNQNQGSSASRWIPGWAKSLHGGAKNLWQKFTGRPG